MASSAPSLRLAFEPRGPWMVVEVAGELDYLTCSMLSARLDALIDGQEQPRVAVDTAGLEFCDSSGIRCLVLAWKRVRGRAGDLVVLRPPAMLRDRITGFGLSATLRMVDELPG